MAQSLQPDAILKRATVAHSEAEEEELVGAFMRGEHWIRDPAREQFIDIGREENLRQQSLEVLQSSQELANDYKTMHIGEVCLPKDTEEQVAEKNRQEAFIERINNRMELFSDYKTLTADVLRCVRVAFCVKTDFA